MTKAIVEEYGKAVRGQVDRYKDWVRTCRLSDRRVARRTWRRSGRDLRHDAARRHPGRGHLAHRRRQAAHRRAARPPRRALHRGRLAGRQPEGRGVLPAGPHRAARSTRRRWWPSGRPAASKGKVDDDPTLRNLVEAGTSTVCIVGKSWDYHVTEALQTDARRGRGHGRRLGRVPRRPGPAGDARRRALLRRLQANPEFALRVLEAAVVQGRQPPRAVRHQRRLAAVRGRARSSATSSTTSATTSSSASTCHDDTGCAVANSIAARAGRRPPRAGHASTGSASAPATATCRPIIPNLTLKMGIAHAARGAPRAAHAGQPPHRRAGEPAAEPAGALRRVVGVRPQGRAARVGHRQGQGRLRARRPRGRSATAPASWCRELAGKATIKMKADELGLPLDGAAVVERHRRAEAARARGLPLRGGRRLARAADAPGRRLGAGLLHGRVASGSSPTSCRTAPFTTEATVKVHVGRRRASSTTAEGNGPVNAIDAALRAAITARYPQLDRVHLTDFKVRILDGAAGTGAVTRVLLDATDGDRDVDHDRREREHHRGVVAGTVRLDRVRLAPWPRPEYVPVPPTQKVPAPLGVARPRARARGRSTGRPRWPAAASRWARGSGTRVPTSGYALTLASRSSAPSCGWRRGEHADDADRRVRRHRHAPGRRSSAGRR